jgi:hypothetical protein
MRQPKTPSSITLLLLLLLTHAVLAEIIELDIIIDASSDEVHFVRGYLKAPASVDLSAVRFISTVEPEFLYGDDGLEFADDTFNNNNEESSNEGNLEGDRDDDSLPDNIGGDEPEGETGFPSNEGTIAPTEKGDDGSDERPASNQKPSAPPTGPEVSVVSDAPTTTPTPGDEVDIDATASPTVGEGGGDRELVRFLAKEATKEPTPQVLDIVLFQVPVDCKKDAWGTCDWAILGVGAYDNEMEGGMSYCCTADTASRGICDKSHIGTLMVDHALLTGDHRKIEVPSTADEEFQMENPAFEVTDSGDYVMVIANCDDYGMEVLALGNMEWKSAGGNLPGDMFGFMFFYAALACIYCALALWYYCGMKMYQDAAIPIQKYIFATMILGLSEVSFRAGDFYVWNLKGLRSDGLMYTGKLIDP